MMSKLPDRGVADSGQAREVAAVHVLEVRLERPPPSQRRRVHPRRDRRCKDESFQGRW